MFLLADQTTGPNRLIFFPTGSAFNFDDLGSALEKNGSGSGSRSFL